MSYKDKTLESPNKEKTEEIHNWLKSLDDDKKQLFAINWRMAHTIFNISCKFKHSEELQDIDWYKIYKSRDLGNWSHGGKVNVLCM